MLVWQLLWCTLKPRYFELRYFEFLPIKEILCIEISLIDSNVNLPHIMSFSLYQVVKVWEGVVVLKELILNSFYFGRVWWSWKNWFWTVCTLGGCWVLKELILNSFYFGRVLGLERTDFEQFLLWEGVVVLKELILNSFYFWRVWWSWKNWFCTVSTLGAINFVNKYMSLPETFCF